MHICRRWEKKFRAGLLHCRMVRTTVDSRPAAEHHRQEPRPPDRLSRTPPQPVEPPPRGGAPQTQRNPEQGLEAAEGTSPQHREEQVRQDCEPEPPPQVQKQPLWKQVVVSRQEADRWPSHLRVFSSDEEYRLVRHTHLMLQRSGFYWGPMSMESAHRVLNACEPGAFLIRDSGRTDIFFTLSYRGDDGPTSVRVLLANQLFSLQGSNKTFDSLLGLLAFYMSGAASGRLRRPYRTERPDRLQAICRRALHRAYGAHRSTHLPGLSNTVRDYLQDYPYDI